MTCSSKAVECASKERFSIPASPIPEILELIDGKNLHIRVRLKPIASKLQPPLYELITEIPILLITFSKPVLIELMYLSTHCSYDKDPNKPFL